MFGAIKKALLRFARKVVEGIMSQLMQQFNVVQEQALAPMRLMVQQVMGGIWVGDGANAFVDEVSSLMIPGVGRVADNIGSQNCGEFALQCPRAPKKEKAPECNPRAFALPTASGVYSAAIAMAASGVPRWPPRPGGPPAPGRRGPGRTRSAPTLGWPNWWRWAPPAGPRPDGRWGRRPVWNGCRGGPRPPPAPPCERPPRRWPGHRPTRRRGMRCD